MPKGTVKTKVKTSEDTNVAAAVMLAVGTVSFFVVGGMLAVAGGMIKIKPVQFRIATLADAVNSGLSYSYTTPYNSNYKNGNPFVCNSSQVVDLASNTTMTGVGQSSIYYQPCEICNGIDAPFCPPQNTLDGDKYDIKKTYCTILGYPEDTNPFWVANFKQDTYYDTLVLYVYNFSGPVEVWAQDSPLTAFVKLGTINFNDDPNHQDARFQYGGLILPRAVKYRYLSIHRTVVDFPPTFDRIQEVEIYNNSVNSYCKPFKRGDANSDGSVDISDTIKIADYLSRKMGMSCKDAADVNNSGNVDTKDVDYLSGFLFKGTYPQPQQPFPNYGLDPNIDTLDCNVDIISQPSQLPLLSPTPTPSPYY